MVDDQGLKIRKRRMLRQREAKDLLREASWLLSSENVKAIEQVELDDGTLLFLINDIHQLVRERDMLYPTLKCNCLEKLPSIVVDMGAVPYVCNGADLMAPGIVEIKGDFQEGGFVVVRDVRHGKALALGKALFSSDQMRATKKGKVVANIHYVGDRLWRAYG